MSRFTDEIVDDGLDEYDMDQDKFMPGKGGKQRSKLEVASHTNKNDPCGQTRKLATKMQNTERNRLNSGGDKAAVRKAPVEEDRAEWRSKDGEKDIR